MGSENDGIPREFVENYVKSNYRVVGEKKHTAIKPCYWLEQKLLTGRSNRNCYKGYWGIKSELCIQNSPAYPFCNQSCVFCWRDTAINLNTTFSVAIDEPDKLVDELIRQQRNMVEYNYPLEKFLKNYDVMNEILKVLWSKRKKNLTDSNKKDIEYSESELRDLLCEKESKKVIARAVLLLKNTNILITEDLEKYYLSNIAIDFLKQNDGDISGLLKKYVTTKQEIIDVHERAMNPKHAAISLDGEPTLYPKIGEFVREFRNRGFTTFIVTNGTTPEVLNKLNQENNLPSQLYLTIAAPNEEAYNNVCRPRVPGTWNKIQKTLNLLKDLKTRTVIRITSVRELNIKDEFVDDYVKIINNSLPNFVDIKGFTLEGASMDISGRMNSDFPNDYYVPSFTELMEFARKLEATGGYKIIATHEKSRDILIRVNWLEDKTILITPDQV